MGCADDDAILQYIDGSLTASEVAALEEHLNGCPACRESLAAYRELYRELAADPAPALPAGFAAAVMAALPAVDFGRERQRRTAARLAGACFALGLGLAPYLLVFPALGPLWDAGKAYASAGLNLLAVAGIFLRIGAGLLDTLLRGLGTIAGALPDGSPLLTPLALLLLLGEVWFVRYTTTLGKGEINHE